jgi:hypothetical protein
MFNISCAGRRIVCNPKGCQIVAGGRRGYGGQATSGQRRKLRRTPAGVPAGRQRSSTYCGTIVAAQLEPEEADSGTPAGVHLSEPGRCPVVVPPLTRTTTGYPLATLRVGLEIRPVLRTGLILFEPARCRRNSTPRRSAARPQPNHAKRLEMT